MDADRAYMAAFLISGDHLDAERAREKVRKQLAVCPLCGDGFEKGDTVETHQGRNAHQQCVVAGAEIGNKEAKDW